jgi:hypothetical protein
VSSHQPCQIADRRIVEPQPRFPGWRTDAVGDNHLHWFTSTARRAGKVCGSALAKVRLTGRLRREQTNTHRRDQRNIGVGQAIITKASGRLKPSLPGARRFRGHRGNPRTLVERPGAALEVSSNAKLQSACLNGAA